MDQSLPDLVLFLLLFCEAVSFFYVFYVPAVFRGGEGYALAGVADGADGVGIDVEVFGICQGDLERVDEEAGAARFELVGGEGLDDFDERELDGGAVFNGG
jgi:hypothetical protein